MHGRFPVAMYNSTAPPGLWRNNAGSADGRFVIVITIVVVVIKITVVSTRD